MSSNAQNRSLKNWRHQRILFLGYTFAKSRYIKLTFGMPYVQAWLCNMLYVFLEILDFVKSYLNFVRFKLFG